MIHPESDDEVAQALLSVRDLEVRYQSSRGTVHAVNAVSFEVYPNEVVGLVGESGCGKSSAIRSILGLNTSAASKTGGSISFKGLELQGMNDKAFRKVRGKEISIVTQSPFGALNGVLPLERQFRNLLRAHGHALSARESFERARDALDEVGIRNSEGVLRGYAHELSGGMAQRVVIAMATILNPTLVIADEPTSALDVAVQRQILDLLRSNILQTPGRSMLMVTHDLGVVAQYCDRVYVLYAGKVVEYGPVSRVLRRPAHPYTRGLLMSVPRRGHRIEVMPGGIADLVDYPAGCPFAARCAHARPECTGQMPPIRSAFPEEGSPRVVRCFAPEAEVSP